jgi:hypothetical protein
VSERKPIDGTAVVLHLIEAARAARDAWHLDPHTPGYLPLVGWVEELERWLPTAPAVGWEPRRWRELVEGDRVSLGGQEAEVTGTSTGMWHVNPDKYRYVEGRGRVYEPLEHEITRLHLKGRDRSYEMPPDGEVETLRGALGQAEDLAAGRHREQVETERSAVLEDWAEQAAQTLRAAGLQPEVIR